MALGTNRDYKTADRRARVQLAKLDTLIALLQKDNPDVSRTEASQIALRIMEHPGKKGACVHRMPQGTSAFVDRVCVRCGTPSAERM